MSELNFTDPGALLIIAVVIVIIFIVYASIMRFVFKVSDQMYYLKEIHEELKKIRKQLDK